MNNNMMKVALAEVFGTFWLALGGGMWQRGAGGGRTGITPWRTCVRRRNTSAGSLRRHGRR
ncbi:hypothetical protein [Citrobacter sp. ESBL3]|uniref:hypothetical protein n=1 Tax=Citrobacter sp. ESBL3 TaxID=3077326 RepID=UPI002FCBA42A